MSAKPTPGPYHITRGALNKSDGPVVCGDDGVMAIAMFLDFGIGKEQQEANARAWVEGREAMEKLERIRAAYKDDSLCDELLVIAVGQILDETKP